MQYLTPKLTQEVIVRLKTFENELVREGVNIVIYANQLLRSAIPAMQKTAVKILKNGRSYESDKDMISIQNTLKIFD